MKRYYLYVLFAGVFLACLPACTARIDGSLAANGSAVLTVSLSLGQRMAGLIRSLAAAGGQASEQILDGAAISKSMSEAPGITSASFRNTSPSAIEGQIRISQISEFLSAANVEQSNRFIIFEQTPSGGRCRININLDNGPDVLENLSYEIFEYLNALMAPIVTGEEMSKSEYLDLITMFYNKAISDEIAASRIRVSIEFPGPVTAVRGGTFTGRRANFDIPLVDLLVAETPLIYEVTWN